MAKAYIFITIFYFFSNFSHFAAFFRADFLGCKEFSKIDAMLDAAQKVIEKYEELESELSTPEVVADQKLYTKLQKQYKGLEKSCQKAREYIQLSSDLAEWKAALGGSDPEFAEAAKEEK